MFSKTKKPDKIDASQREQYEYARKRVVQKKRLMRHFILFLVGSIFLIILNAVLGIGQDFYIKNWFVYYRVSTVFLPKLLMSLFIGFDA